MTLFPLFNTDSTSREVFNKDGVIASKVHPVLAQSWIRSANYEIDPNIYSAPAIAHFNLNDVEQLLVDIAKPYIKYFTPLLANNETILALCNSNAAIIHVEKFQQCRKMNRAAEKHNFLEGADWREKSIGTNAFGTAIEQKTNLIVIGAEHYALNLKNYSCAASPIFNLSNGEIFGVLDITFFGNKMHQHSIGLVSAMARLIEKDVNSRINGFPRKENGEKAYFSVPNISFKSNNVNIEMVGQSPVFNSALKIANKTAATHLNVFLNGETGSGKEVFARYIHYNSNRNQGPFVAVNCAAIPKELVASELFGYSDGAFTGAAKQGRSGRFEQANGGTIFLDEIGDAPYEVQVGLLRVLEEKTVNRIGSERGIPVDVRVLSATSRDLGSLVNQGLFREDLYYRLSGVIVEIPALRERDQDIILLAEHFLNRFKAGTLRDFYLNPELKQLMLEYDWPGNIRELRNLVERMAALSDTEELTKELMLKCMPRKGELRYLPENPEKNELVDALKAAKGKISRTAELLAVDRATVYRRMRKYGLEPKRI